MLQFLRVLSICLLFISCSIFAVQDASQLTDTSKPILLGKNTNQVKIKLSSTPSTGYSWRLKRYDSNLVIPVSKTYQGPKESVAGGDGVETFTFIVTKNLPTTKGSSHISFVYLRPWNKDIAKTVTIKLVIPEVKS